MSEIHELSAVELRQRYQSRELSPVEVVHAIFERIDGLEPDIHAFITQTRDLALKQAKSAEREWLRNADHPPLLGIPITIKDLVDVAGVPTTMGSLVTSREPAAEDELFVEHLRRSGAVILGKTNTSEFGLAAQTMTRLGPATANPHNLERTAGGSSGGAAAACAAGFGPLHHGTDGGGSVRVPAAYCGVVGFKPTGRRIPRRTRGRRHVANLHRRRPRPHSRRCGVDGRRHERNRCFGSRVSQGFPARTTRRPARRGDHRAGLADSLRARDRNRRRQRS